MSKSLLEHCKESKAIVDTWPSWKKEHTGVLKTSKYCVKVGKDNHRPWEQHSRASLEYHANVLGFSEGFIEELTDQELFNKIISEGCRQLSKMED